MEKEKMHLIQEKADALIAEYKSIAETAKEQGDTITAYAYVAAQNAVLRLMIEILTLDKKNLI